MPAKAKPTNRRFWDCCLEGVAFHHLLYLFDAPGALTPLQTDCICSYNNVQASDLRSSQARQDVA